MFPGPQVSPNGPHGAGRAPTLVAMTAPEVGAHRTQLDAAVRHLALQVNRDTVLQARAALLAEAERLDSALRARRGAFSGVGLCGGDPVSPEAAQAFTERIDALVANCRSYNSDLRASATALDATARAYGFTDSEIAESFRLTS